MYSANKNIMLTKNEIYIPLENTLLMFPLLSDRINVINEINEKSNPSVPISKKQYKQKLTANKIDIMSFAVLFSGASLFLLLKTNIAAAIAILDTANR